MSENKGLPMSGEYQANDTSDRLRAAIDYISKVDSITQNLDIKRVDKEKATSNASKLSALSADTTVTVSGNTDEWGSDEYNYALGLKRANSVKDALVANGVNANIALVSLGESSPVCTEKTKACWAKNRRVEHDLSK